MDGVAQKIKWRVQQKGVFPMHWSRRQFLASTLAAGCLGLAGRLAPAMAAGLPVAGGSALLGRVYAFGMSPQKYPGNTDPKHSILTDLNLADGTFKQTELNMQDGHAAMPAGDGRILCVSHHKNTSMMLDKNHAILKTFVAPENYLYGGHGLVLRERNLFVLPMRHAKPVSLADTGRIEIYDLTTLEKKDMVDSGGIQPHEIRLIPGHADEIAVTHYGNLATPNDPLEFNIADSKLTILDAASFKPKRHYSQNERNAMTTHMRVDKDGWAYIVFTQYIQYNRLKLQPGQDVHAAALAELKRLYGQEWGFPIPAAADEEKHLAISLPFVRINTQTGETQIIDAGMEHHIRSQSVAYNVATGTAIALYHHSGDLVLHKAGGAPELITAAELGLKDVRGVADIPGTTRIAVCGTYEDVAVMDLPSRKVEAHFTTSNYNSTHIYHEADI